MKLVPVVETQVNQVHARVNSQGIIRIYSLSQKDEVRLGIGHRA